MATTYYGTGYKTVTVQTIEGVYGKIAARFSYDYLNNTYETEKLVDSEADLYTEARIFRERVAAIIANEDLLDEFPEIVRKTWPD